MTAEQDLLEYLGPDEVVEAVVFGQWGWSGFGAPDPEPVPTDRQGVVLTWDEARPMMQTWRFRGGFGAPDCYAVRIWTNLRVLWVTQYEGATGLDSSPRNPTAHMPDMPGG